MSAAVVTAFGERACSGAMYAGVPTIPAPVSVRGSSGSIATETVDSIRLKGIDADRAVARLVDRLLMRGKEGR